MAKSKRKYGDAWKDVQIDAEQNDAVFDRFFKHSEARTLPASPQEERKSQGTNDTPGDSRLTGEARGVNLSPPASQKNSSAAKTDLKQSIVSAPPFKTIGYVDSAKQRFRLSKGEANLLKHFIQLTHEAGVTECYATIPKLAEVSNMTARGCQLALKNLQSRGFITRVREYDPTDRLGIRFRVELLPL